ncbi:WAS/WASL-interacting protein family member 1-like [Nilaparvata lugens]|uniref:WAS/WASL-interacting protein family member 1-like n=1 Tax=Nilaparvata lugens TaxID=108931 RepID=UPI00193E8E3F|nr:WAS/WASL-interacting protein family member 1-like [Nilaparvata lugens]
MGEGRGEAGERRRQQRLEWIEFQFSVQSTVRQPCGRSRGLCCFPGFSHPGSAPRKGKIPQPLLASVGGGFEAAGGFLQGLVGGGGGGGGSAGGGGGVVGGGGSEMMLLEKQGLCSQQQRQTGGSGSLPPSSLPRPKRHHKSPSAGRERRLGEYGRLSDGEGSKASANSSADASDPKSHRESPVRSLHPRKLGEYNRLNNDSTSKTSCDSTDKSRDRDSPLPIPPRKLGEYGRFSSDSTNRKLSDNAETITDISRSSPVRYSPSRFDSAKEYNRKLSTGSDKTRDSPSRSLLPPPKKLPDYSSCFEGASQASRRRGSLGQPPVKAAEPGVRSLPPPNKYRIQF